MAFQCHHLALRPRCRADASSRSTENLVWLGWVSFAIRSLLSASLSREVSVYLATNNPLLFLRSISAAERCLAPIGRPGLWGPDPAMAVSAGAARRFVQRRLHQLGGPIGRVPAHRPGRGGQALGRAQGQAQYEL